MNPFGVERLWHEDEAMTGIAARDLATLIEQIGDGHLEALTISRNGACVAVIIDPNTYAQLLGAAQPGEGL